ncbi:MAG: hypothetical protein QW292_04085, partial [Candidatus Parvarchaeota archaeon]
KGMVGYISQPDYLKQWSWMHMSGSNEDPNMWADLLVTDINIGRRNIALFSGRIDGIFVHANFMPATFRGIAGLSGIEGSVTLNGETFNINSKVSRQKTIKVKYDSVKKYDRYCYNSEVAYSSIFHRNRSYTSNSSFIEYGTMKDIKGFSEVAVNDMRGTPPE